MWCSKNEVQNHWSKTICMKWCLTSSICITSITFIARVHRGVIMGPIERKKVPTKKQPAQHNVPLRLAPSVNNNNNNNANNTNVNNSSTMASPWNLNGMKQKLV